MNYNDLINEALTALKPYTDSHSRIHADVGAVVVAKDGSKYKGVCVDTASWGLCAERSAIAAMITAGQYEIDKVVAVWRHPETSKIHVLPPCGVCREFMRSIHDNNLETEVILSDNSSEKLKALLPYHEWPEPLE